MANIIYITNNYNIVCFIKLTKNMRELKIKNIFKKRNKEYNSNFKNYIPYVKRKLDLIIKEALPKDEIIEEVMEFYLKEGDLYREDFDKLYINPSLKKYIEKYEIVPKIEYDDSKLNYKSNFYIRYPILGDIIGSCYEFKNHDKVNDIFNDIHTFTDDTVLSIATMEAILEDDKNPDFKKWYLKYFNKYEDAGFGGAFYRYAKNNSNEKGYGSFGNGSAMRVAYIGLYYNDSKDVIKYAFLSSIVTHNHFEGVKAAVIIAMCVWMAKKGYSKQDIWLYVYNHYHKNQEELELLKEFNFYYYDFSKEFPDITKKQKEDVSLYAGYAVPYAIDCFYKTNSYEECMLEIINKFGDTDTICAIASSVAGIYYNPYDKEFIDEKLKACLDNYLYNKIIEKDNENG